MGEILSVALPLVGLLVVSFLGFKPAVKQEALEKQHGICPVCGEKLSGKCEGHHALPKSRGGNNSVENCVILHGSKGRDCHEEKDIEALKEGLIFIPPSGPVVPISEVPDSLKSPSFNRKMGNIFKHQAKHHKHNRHGR